MIVAQARGDELDKFFGHAFVAGFGFPEVEDLCQPADDGVVGVFVLSFKTEKFTEFFDGRLHSGLFYHGEGEDKDEGKRMQVGNWKRISIPNHS